GVEGEAVLFAAARADHVERVIRPALASGHWVVSDRFFDSTRVYQAAADAALLAGLERIAVGRTRPDLTFILDLPAFEGLARAEGRMAASGTEPDRCVVVDATPAIGAIADDIWQTVTARLIGQAAERSNA